MKTFKKRERKLMRTRNRDRINRNKNQQMKCLFIMALIKWELDDLSPEQVVARLRYYITMLTGNADFPVISPTLIQLGDKADELETAIATANNGDRLLIEQRNIIQLQAEDMIRSLAWDIQKKSDGDAVKMHSAGFGTRNGPSPSVIPGQVINLSAKSTGSGKIKLRWKKDPYALVYVVETTTNPVVPPPPPQNYWDTVGKSFKASIELTELQPGQMYYFRVYAANQMGDGEISEITNARCL